MHNFYVLWRKQIENHEIRKFLVVFKNFTLREVVPKLWCTRFNLLCGTIPRYVTTWRLGHFAILCFQDFVPSKIVKVANAGYRCWYRRCKFPSEIWKINFASWFLCRTFYVGLQRNVTFLLKYLKFYTAACFVASETFSRKTSGDCFIASPNVRW